MTDASLLLPTT